MPSLPPSPPTGRDSHDEPDGPADQPLSVTRRSFVQTLGLSAAATTISTASTAIAKDRAAERARPPKAAEPEILGPEPVDVTLNVNGKPLSAKLDPATTLLEALRINHGLTGAKEICDRGACGGCSVIIDGRVTLSCMTLALDAVGTQITTVEGLATSGPNGGIDPVQAAFVKHDAMQCGYCTPGLVVACRAILNKTPKPTVEQIKHGLAGNICRCGTYTNIINAVLEASGQQPLMDATLATAAKGGG